MRFLLFLATRYTSWKLAHELYPHHTPLVLEVDPHEGPSILDGIKVEARDIDGFCDAIRGDRVDPADFKSPYTSAKDEIVLVVDHAEPAMLVKVMQALTAGYDGFHGRYTILEVRWNGNGRPRILTEREHPLTWMDAPGASLSAAALRRLQFEADMAEVNDHNDAEAERYPNV